MLKITAIRKGSGSLLNRLNDLAFLGKFVLFERSEFTNFPLKKRQQSSEKRFSRECFLLLLFFAQAKKSREKNARYRFHNRIKRDKK
ncbi:hypothetical protein F480_01710 [Bibersteinia trehalosi Y31]|uniref:Uncharacterized protein n=1 Tax=Bibersteinia trehalosi Y31 TaxID=1261658 RepID=A0A179CZC1_BIBTR|nr:hypothetical protein F480_01710 [Bibersteinia trehalosi Y31]